MSIPIRPGCIPAVAVFAAIALGSATAVANHDGAMLMEHGEGAHGGHAAAPAPHAMGTMPDDDAAHGMHSGDAMRAMGNAAPNVHELHMATSQRVLAHNATIYALMAALGVERDRHLTLLRQARDEFQQIQDGLRHGDAAAGLPGISHPEILAAMDNVERVWTRYRTVVDQIVERSHVSVQHVTALTLADPPLHEALAKMSDAVEYYSYQGRGFSVLLPTVRHAEHLNTVLQQLVADYLLVAYRHDSGRDDRSLLERRDEFDRLLKALMEGDPDLRVLAAPTPEIMEQFARVQLTWQECWDAIARVPADHAADPASIAAVREQVERLSEEVGAVVDLYHFL